MCNLIEENDVSPVNISVELERAVIDHRLEENQSIYVTEGNWFPFWIRVLPEPNLITLSTYTYFRKNTTLLERLELCNSFNRSQFMVTAYLNDDHIAFDHALTYKDGIIRENLIRVCRKFNEQISSAIEAFDPEFAIMLRPGQTEEQGLENE